MTQSIARKDLGYLEAHAPLPAASVAFLRAAVLFAKWDTLRRTRKDLMDLDTHTLRDIGLTPDQARIEAKRPFWQD
jgi:uncharacterized protein YjiS (DUF1127 family)